MNDESSNPNIEWKKPGFDFNEKITLKTNVRKAVEYEAKNKNAGIKTYSPGASELPNGLRKIRKKIKNVLDEENDDDEDEFQIASGLPQDNNALFNALQENEKKVFKIQEEISSINSMQQAGRNQAIMSAEKIAHESGLKNLSKKVIAGNMQDITLGQDITANVVTAQAARSFRYKGEKIPASQAKNLIKGIQRIQEVGGKEAISGLSFNEVMEAGAKKREDKEVIKMMLEKSGRIDSDGKVIQQKAGATQQKNAEMIKKLDKNRF